MCCQHSFSFLQYLLNAKKKKKKKKKKNTNERTNKKRKKKKNCLTLRSVFVKQEAVFVQYSYSENKDRNDSLTLDPKS